MFFYLSKLLFSGLLRFKSNFEPGQNSSKYNMVTEVVYTLWLNIDPEHMNLHDFCPPNQYWKAFVSDLIRGKRSALANPRKSIPTENFIFSLTNQNMAQIWESISKVITSVDTSCCLATRLTCATAGQQRYIVLGATFNKIAHKQHSALLARNTYIVVMFLNDRFVKTHSLLVFIFLWKRQKELYIRTYTKYCVKILTINPLINRKIPLPFSWVHFVQFPLGEFRVQSKFFPRWSDPLFT